jgi:type IV secretion/conjugal transfer VirB4 family ATPase
MVPIKRILRDHQQAGSLNGLVAVWGFVDDHTFLTKAGALGVVYRLHARDAECLDHHERRAVAERFEQALKYLDDTYRVYQYCLKRPIAPIVPRHHSHPMVDEALRRRAADLTLGRDQLFEFELYLVVLREGAARRTGRRHHRLFHRTQSFAMTVRDSLSQRRTIALLQEDITHSIARLRQTANAFAVHLADVVRPELLGKADAFRLFRRLLNYTAWKADAAPFKYDTHLDFFATDSSLECHRGYLQMDDIQIRVLTMKEPPAKTFAHILEDLALVPTPFISCLEWRRRPTNAVRREIHARRRHFFNKRVSMVNYVSPQTKHDEVLVDESASAVVSELGQSLTDMDVHGHVFGECSFTVVLYHQQKECLDQGVAACAKVFANHDGALHDETYNLLNAWLAVLPGNAAHNLRRLTVPNTTCADLAQLFTVEIGHRESPHLPGQEYLAAFETLQRTPYFWNLHWNDVGHALILGATGSGKSFLLNFILTHVQKYDPITVIFDLGGGYSRLTGRLGGSTWRVGLTHRDFTINPFWLEPTPENLHFLFSFVRVLLQTGDQCRLTTDDDRELYDAVTNIYALDAPQRRLITLASLLPRALAQHLARWICGGPYAELFDNGADTLTFQRVQCFDFEGLESYPVILEPVLFYVLHRASTSIRETDATLRLKLFVLDEAWRFARDPTVKAYITEALKTWRKHNAAMLLATQSSKDFAQRDLLRTVTENCPTKMLLANPSIDLDEARLLFHLNETESRTITELVPRRQLLLKRPDVSKVLELRVDQQSYWMYTNTPLDNTRVNAAVAEFGLAAGLEHLAGAE